MNGQPPGTAWEAGHLTRRIVLPPDAEIAVAVGQQVEPATTLAHVPAASTPVVLSLSSELGTSAARMADHLTVEVGDTVEVGTVLAERRSFVGMRRQTVTAPQAGHVAFVSMDTGTIIIHPDDSATTMPALVYGTVAALEEAPVPTVVLDAPGVAIAGALSFGESSWGPLILWEEPDPPAAAGGWTSWEGAVVFLRGEATADLLASAAEHRAAAVVAPGSTAPLPGTDWHSTAPESELSPAVPTLLIYGQLAPALPDGMLHALRSLAGTTVGIAGADQRGAPELLLTGPAAGDTAERIGQPSLKPGRDAVILCGALASTVVRVIKTTETHLFQSEWRGPAAQVEAADGSTLWAPLVSLVPLPTVRSD
ncbi:MAG: hypothetical protein CL878_07715 [Dehalococcoidia bacterium]|nr:hypothetical protein [Dehalococcoidia bacterium]